VPELTRDSAPLTIPLFASGASTGNAFEPVVRGRFLAVATALDWLGRFGAARLSGSGGCVFAAFPSREAGAAALAEVPEGMRAWLARGVRESKLRQRLRVWRS
jgi:4-diphosphocytidyl-2-C-methyl-D-erythritol kinase